MIKKVQFVAVANLVAISVIICMAICCQQQVQQGITEEEVKVLNERILNVWNNG